MLSFRPAIKACWDTARSRRQPRSCAMLRATVKLCCGIAHDHLRRLPGKHRSPPLPPREKQAEKRLREEMLSLHPGGIPLEMSCLRIYFPPTLCHA